VKDNKFLYIPIEKTTKELQSYKIIKREFSEYCQDVNSYKKILSIPKKLKDLLPTAYDVIGNIIVIKLDEELIEYKNDIGESLLSSKKNIETVCLTKPVTGELRTRELEIIAGKISTKTIHKEYGLRFEVDISKVYFSPRLATERKRIADLVKKNEVVVDMFAGVAPFSILIAKYANPKIVVAIDKNKDASYFANRNIKINKVLDKVEFINSDAKEINKILNKKELKADRVIMNLPFSSYSFFKYALKVINQSCQIHYYEILKKENINKRIRDLKKIADKDEIFLTDFKTRKIKTYAPREFYIGIDITAKRNMPM
jgi:tRNA (guanine37-N1)-methyltransferase